MGSREMVGKGEVEGTEGGEGEGRGERGGGGAGGVGGVDAIELVQSPRLEGGGIRRVGVVYERGRMENWRGWVRYEGGV